LALASTLKRGSVNGSTRKTCSPEASPLTQRTFQSPLCAPESSGKLPEATPPRPAGARSSRSVSPLGSVTIQVPGRPSSGRGRGRAAPRRGTSPVARLVERPVGQHVDLGGRVDGQRHVQRLAVLEAGPDLEAQEVVAVADLRQLDPGDLEVAGGVQPFSGFSGVSWPLCTRKASAENRER
jgi:hypothetical protein